MSKALLPILLLTVANCAVSQSIHPRFIEPGSTSDLPRIVANDNRTPAGVINGDTLEVDLEVVWGDWRIETPDGPGLGVEAVAEWGRSPTIPAPLIRAETGTTIRVRIRNQLNDSSLVVFGLQTRPAETADSLVVEPGRVGSVTFDAGEAGTYFYKMRLGAGLDPFFDEREQLAGGLIVDPRGGSPPDRVFVLNIFGTPLDTTGGEHKWLEALTINGKSWPFTEIQKPAVGDRLRWRVVNATARNHPMHLHGFFYDVLSRGRMLGDDIYSVRDVRSVVTEFMFHGTTMLMQWVPTRPGKWLFHCHLSFHVTPAIRLPMAGGAHGGGRHGEDVDSHHQEPHMAGLVLGIEVDDGPSDLISRGEPRYITLYALEFPDDSLATYAFSLEPDFRPDSIHLPTPGPVLDLKQHQPTFVTVENRMSIPTGIHWHGLELDSWSDGVPGWSASDGKVSPVIPPGGSFTYKLALMRPGTFIYHSHLDDIHQLTGGLYGPLLVFAESETYDPTIDHVYGVGWQVPEISSLEEAELNGRFEQPVQEAVVGETHRLRLFNIAPAGRVSIRMMKGELPVPLKYVAKDGADLPPHQQVNIETSPVYGVGETADFAFTPGEAGTYTLEINYPRAGWSQRWEVRGQRAAGGK